MTARRVSIRPRLVALAIGLLGPTVTVLGDRPLASGMVMGIFEDATGDRLARIQVETIRIEARQRGFIRVAWPPLLVFDGVTLDLRFPSAKNIRTAHLRRAFEGLDRTRYYTLRRVRVLLAYDAPIEIAAAWARLTDSELLLHDARVSSELATQSGGSDVRLWLSGPKAGQWEPVGRAAERANTSESASLPPRSP